MEPLTLGPASFSLFISPWHSWTRLREQAGGRLYQSTPFAQPCYDSFNSSTCAAVRGSYLDEVARSETPTAFIQSQWETCQTTKEHCLLDWTNPDNDEPTQSSECQPGSLPSHYIDVQSSDDVKAAFDFSRNTKIPISIRNTGHDYKGRSSAPGSLGLWLHNLQNISYNPEFVPHGCDGRGTQQPAVMMGAGVRWNEAHIFADKHNVTIVGGSDKSVGAVGGWLQGGGHGALSNTMGMGADRVLEFEVVTPDGQLRIANECQNSDLFWALRGGGGSTFGVVLSATVLASPAVKLQTLIFSWRSPDASVSLERTRKAWSLFADASIRLAEEGWGGYVTKDVAVLINPKAPSTFASRGTAGEEASEMWEGSAIMDLVNWGKSVQRDHPETVLIQKEFPNWLSFFNVFTAKFVASVGKNLALSSRLVPKSSLSTPASRAAVVDALMDANTVTTAPGVIILFTTPASFPDPERKTSVNPAWRESIYHITSIETWAWNATRDEVKASYRRAKDSLGKLREMTGGEEGAAYVNEADVYEEGWERTFWGDNYDRLVEVKRKYDPDHLLDCWHCVGFERESDRFGCYLDV